MVILDPRWLQNVMATVISTKSSFIRDGILKHSTLLHIWKPPDYPSHLHGYILSILEKFEIMFHLNDSKFTNEDAPKLEGETPEGGSSLIGSDQMSLLPSLLPERQPKDFENLWPPRKSPSEYIPFFFCPLKKLPYLQYVHNRTIPVWKKLPIRLPAERILWTLNDSYDIISYPSAIILAVWHAVQNGTRDHPPHNHAGKVYISPSTSFF